MIDIKLPLRTAYYQLLNGAVIYNAVAVPVSSDEKKLVDNTASTYIIISSQYGSDTSTMSTFDSQESIVIQVVCKAKTRVNREIVDQVAGQVMNLVLPTPKTNGLPPQSGMHIDCVQKSGDQNLDLIINASTSAIRRVLTFTQKVRQF